MACIIKMSSDEFLDKFIKKFDYRKFNFLLISEQVKTERKYKNVYTIPTLIPPPNIIAEFVQKGYTPRYIRKFVEYLQVPRVEAMITIMVKLCVVENSNVILLCSKQEDEFKYLDIICQYIENIYGINTYNYKDYKKDPSKCEEISEKDKKKAIKVLEKKLSEIEDLGDPAMTKKEARARFKKLPSKEIKKYLAANSIKYKDKWSRKELIKAALETFN